MNTREFIAKARKVHGDKYDYSKVNYINSDTKVCIICPKHGEFWQIASNHIRGKGCKECYREKRLGSRSEFTEKANKIHGNKYDYSKVEYFNSRTKVCIICQKHGEFWQTPSNHLEGRGCPKCAKEKNDEILKKEINKFIEECNEVHNFKYIYKDIEYKNNYTKIKIICPIHGEFWQTPKNHLKGNGCPKCNSSKLEKFIRTELEKSGNAFEEQKGFDWLINNKPMKLDFYLPKYNVSIECQGMQHFDVDNAYKLGWFDGTRDFNLIKKFINKNIEKDKLKEKLCNEHEIKIFYYSNLGINYPYKVYEDFNAMLDKIKNEK